MSADLGQMGTLWPEEIRGNAEVGAGFQEKGRKAVPDDGGQGVFGDVWGHRGIPHSSRGVRQAQDGG